MFFWTLLTAVAAAFLYGWIARDLARPVEKLGIIFFLFLGLVCDSVSRVLMYNVLQHSDRMVPGNHPLLIVPALAWYILGQILINNKRAFDSLWYLRLVRGCYVIWLAAGFMTINYVFGPQIKAFFT